MRLKLLLLLFLFLDQFQVHAQYFQFSQYNFTPQRINPATVGTSNYATLHLISRNQSTGGDFNLTSNIINAAYPLINKKRLRWGGLGFAAMDDRSGFAGIYNTQEVSLSYAMNVYLGKYQTLSLGVKGLYQSKFVNPDKLTTGLQYVPDLGFERELDNGENFNQYRKNLKTLSSGIYWQNTDKKGHPLGHVGLSFFDFNRPDDSYLGTGQLNSTLITSLGFQVYSKNKISLYPEALYTLNAAKSLLNIGVKTQYELKSRAREESERIEILTQYITSRVAVLGIQLHKRNFGVGISYDFPVSRNSVANTGALELGLVWKNLILPLKGYKKKKKKSSTPVQQINPVKTIKDTTHLSVNIPNPITPPPDENKNENLSERLKHKQDSIHTLATAGDIEHQPFELEKVTLHFNFEFGSAHLNKDAEEYLNEMVRALKDNPDLKISLVGHTDDVGSEKFNLKLSLERAYIIMDYLVENDIEEDRIKVEGKGEWEPITDNLTEENRAKNRRVELTILYDY